MSEKVCPSCTNTIPESSAFCPYCYYVFDEKKGSSPDKKEEKEQKTEKTVKPETTRTPDKVESTVPVYTPPSRDVAKPQQTVPTKTDGTTPKPQQTVSGKYGGSTAKSQQEVPGKTNGSTPNPQGVNSRKPRKILRLLALGAVVYAIYMCISSYTDAQAEKLRKAQIEMEARQAEEEEARRLAEEEEARKLAEEEAAQNPFANIEYADQYVFPDSNLRYLTDEEVENLDFPTLRIAINELYARHGYVFSSEDMSAYFGSLDWYEPNPEYTNSEAVVTLFNEYETANKLLLVKYRDLLKQ